MTKVAAVADEQLHGSSYEAMMRDVRLGDEDLDRISQLIHRWAGIVLTRQKHGMVYSRLARRVRELGLSCFSEYLDILERSGNEAERERFINALTTNLTAFFREAHHFSYLADFLRGRPEPIRIWCNAASTGEEAYSVAMTIVETLGPAAKAEILATDIDTEALAQAEKGVYPLEQVLKLESRGAIRHFLKGRGRYARFAKVRPEIQAMVKFAPLNLVAPHWPEVSGRFDAIFCRNVMIYFDKATQTRLLKRFVPLLKPDGLLFVGHSENVAYLSEDYVSRGQTVYALAEHARGS